MGRLVLVGGKLVEEIRSKQNVFGNKVYQTDSIGPRTWADWTSWSQNPYETIIYEHIVYDIGAKVYFRPLVSVVASGTITIEESHSDDNITYTAWAPGSGTELYARYLKIKVTVVNTTAIATINSLTIKLSTDTLEESVEDLDTSTLTQISGETGHVKIPVNLTFAAIKGVTITLQNVGSQYSVELLSKADNVDGPEIQIWNGATRANATIDAFIRGV